MRSRWRVLAAAASIAFASTAALRCGSSLDRGQGDLAIDVALPPNFQIVAMTYTVNGGAAPLTQPQIVSGAPATTSALFTDVPAGHYDVVIDARTADDGAACQTTAAAQVWPGRRSNVFVQLTCVAPADGIAGTFECAQITSIVVAPTTTGVGGTVDLQAHAFVTDGGSPAFAWAAGGGSIANATAASATFTCAAAGLAAITLTVTNGSCQDSATVAVDCVPSAP